MRRNIRESAIGEVGESTEVLFSSRADVVIQVSGYGASLVRRASEVVAEASGAGDPGNLRADGLSAADCGNIGTRSWELRRKLWCIFAVVGLTGCTDACGVRQRMECIKMMIEWHRGRWHTYLCRQRIREQRFPSVLIVQSCSKLAWRTSLAQSSHRFSQ